MFWGVIICDVTFIICAYMINEKNADMLLAGYNTMSKKEKESFDLKNYLIFLIFLVFYGETTAFIVYLASTLIPLPYLIYKGNKFKIKK